MATCPHARPRAGACWVDILDIPQPESSRLTPALWLAVRPDLNDPAFLDRQVYSREDPTIKRLHCIDLKKLLRCFCGTIDSLKSRQRYVEQMRSGKSRDSFIRGPSEIVDVTRSDCGCHTQVPFKPDGSRLCIARNAESAGLPGSQGDIKTS